MDATTWLIATGVLFLLKLLSGYWLSRSGKPYKAGISAIHKLISLATVASIALTVRALRQGAGLSGAQTGALVATGVLFLTAIGTGGVLSIGKPAPAVVSVAHKAAPYLALIATAATLYLAV